jgi:putative ABC transport system ATP-binding protein
MEAKDEAPRRKKLNLYRLPPKDFTGKEDVISFTNLQKTYKLQGRSENVTALKSVSLQAGTEFYPVKKGEFVMIRGPSGGGKTTMLNLIGTIDSSTGGELTIMNKKID